MTDQNPAVALDPECLQCGQKRSKVRAEGLYCATISAGLQPEVDQEWDRHRWVDLTDRELAKAGVRPEAYDKHRRTDISVLGWIDCEDKISGHKPVTEQDAAQYEWLTPGHCWFCHIDLRDAQTTTRDTHA